MLQGKNILVIIGGGIAAYKSLSLIRLLKQAGADVQGLLTPNGGKFVTPLSVGALTGKSVYSELFTQYGEHDVSHINIARHADLIIVAPASADRMAKVAAGFGDDLAGTILLATRSPVLFAPAMNPAMWENSATQRNLAQLKQDGHYFIGPEIGEMAEKGEYGLGRMSEPEAIVYESARLLSPYRDKLSGKHFIVTSGPTIEPLDPIRYITNRSSSKQGYAVAQALADMGARVSLISGPTSLNAPFAVNTTHVETGRQMLDAVKDNLPADGAIFVAAVSDWGAKEIATQKIKKQPGQDSYTIELVKMPDILAEIAHSADRPKLVIGFAAETDNVLKNAQAKFSSKGADAIVLNDVSANIAGSAIMGGDHNHISIIDNQGTHHLSIMSKKEVGFQLACYIEKKLNN